MSELVPCSGCSRHIRDDETACPFCSAPAPSVRRAAPDLRALTRPLSRAALALAGMAALAGCEKPQTAPAYGGPPITTTEDGSAPAPITTEVPPAPAYGGPPPMLTTDAGAKPPAPVTTMHNVPAPAYGGPPPQKH